ncbi:MAG: TlpA disulfide reductase family protein [Chitinophagaceae bacterium]
MQKIMCAFFLLTMVYYNCKNGTTHFVYTYVSINYEDTTTGHSLVQIGIGGIGGYARLYTIEKTGLNARIPTTSTGLTLFLKYLDKDTTVRLLQPDSVIVEATGNGLVIKTLKKPAGDSIYFRLKKVVADFRGKNDTIDMHVYQVNDSTTFLQKFKQVSRILEGKYINEKNNASSLCAQYSIPDNVKRKVLEDIDIYYQMRSYNLYTMYGQWLDSSAIRNEVLVFIHQTEKLSKDAFWRNNVTLVVGDMLSYLQDPDYTSLGDDGQSILDRYRVIQKYLKRESVAYQWLISTLEMYAYRHEINMDAAAMEHLKKEADNSVFKDDVMAQIAIYKAADAYNTAMQSKTSSKTLYDEDWKSVSLSDVLASFKGRPLLIDFWASWCIPCIQGLPRVKHYNARFPSLNILYLSMDQDHYNWKKAIADRELMSYANYRVNQSHKDPLIVGINEIPQYGLLYKDGTLKILDEIDDEIIQAYVNGFSL